MNLDSMPNNETNIEQKVDAIILKKWHLVAGVLSFLMVFVVPAMIAFFQTKMDVELIKQNHMSHMETMQGQIKEMQEDQKEMLTQIKEDHDDVVRLKQTYQSK
jgi:uncharacterized membrane protein (DUF106 family)